MPLWPDSIILEAVRAVFGFGLLASGWFLGQKIVASWDIRKKRQELDIGAAVQFQQLYGELKEVGRLWRESRKSEASEIGLPEGLRWSLLARGANAESKYEAVVMKLASERELAPDQLAALGLFRQACQQLRQSIRKNEEVSWTDFGPEYFLFNDLAAEVTCLISMSRPRKPISSGTASVNLEGIAKVRGSHWRDEVNKYHALADKRAASHSSARALCTPEISPLPPLPSCHSERASPVALAILAGALALSVTDSIPGGLDGARGFVLGTLLTLMAIWLSVTLGREGRGTADKEADSFTITRSNRHE